MYASTFQLCLVTCVSWLGKGLKVLVIVVWCRGDFTKGVGHTIVSEKQSHVYAGYIYQEVVISGCVGIHKGAITADLVRGVVTAGCVGMWESVFSWAGGRVTVTYERSPVRAESAQSIALFSCMLSLANQTPLRHPVWCAVKSAGYKWELHVYRISKPCKTCEPCVKHPALYLSEASLCQTSTT